MQLLHILFSPHGRINRDDFQYAVLLILSVFITLLAGANAVGFRATIVLYPPLYWSLFVLSAKRYHDLGRSAGWLLLLVIPVIGPLWVFFTPAIRKGQQFENRFGPLPGREELDYFTVKNESNLAINDITRLNPTPVRRIVRPTTLEEISAALKESKGPVSIGGGHFSMGGQTSCADSLHIDMRSFNQILHFSPSEEWIRVQAGARWCDLQRFLDPHELSIRIMQSYANFTVGGALSVNCHGRYVGLGPIVLSVRAITILLADGRRVRTSPSENSELFYAAIGGYGAIGIIVEAELDLAHNERVMCMTEKLAVGDYLPFFQRNVRDNKQAVFHNADLYPPRYTRALAQTWVETDRPVTQTSRLMPLRSSFALERYGYWAISETPLGKWRREYVFDPLLFFRRKVHWRNYEAGYDVAELEPVSRARKTYVLQEYFVPVARFNDFVPRMAEILNRHNVNVLNVSVRHALPDPGTLLAWAREEVFAFVLYYKQGCDQPARDAVAKWTRELIECVLSAGGTYYLPYQPHATPEQFHCAYPRARELFALKRKLDPDFRFQNSLWTRYYMQTLEDVHDRRNDPIGISRDLQQPQAR
ncbi:MAG TPA: FAD-binding protein [Phycisphaerae bacterium]|nr:FAD-binding protein [Phycisphaerae bacterium]